MLGSGPNTAYCGTRVAVVCASSLSNVANVARNCVVKEVYRPNLIVKLFLIKRQDHIQEQHITMGM